MQLATASGWPRLLDLVAMSKARIKPAQLAVTPLCALLHTHAHTPHPTCEQADLNVRHDWHGIARRGHAVACGLRAGWQRVNSVRGDHAAGHRPPEGGRASGKELSVLGRLGCVAARRRHVQQQAALAGKKERQSERSAGATERAHCSIGRTNSRRAAAKSKPRWLTRQCRMPLAGCPESCPSRTGCRSGTAAAKPPGTPPATHPQPRTHSCA